MYYRQKITEKCHRTSSRQPLFFINNIYYNICSKSLKGSSRELTLFALKNKNKYKNTQQLTERFDSENKRLDKLKQPNVNLKISSRNAI